MVGWCSFVLGCGKPFFFFLLLSHVYVGTGADEDREMAIGNTFGATVLSSYGGFWISVAITFIPSGFEIMPALEKADGGTTGMFYDSFALF